MVPDSEVEVLVLHFTDLGEADRIVTFLTRDRGLLRAAVSGARGVGKGRAAAFDLFAWVRIDLHHSHKPGRLPRVRGATLLDPHLALRESYPRLCAASYIAETVARSAQEEDPVPGVAEMTLFCLDKLGKGRAPASIVLLFEARFLKEMGWLPELTCCLSCKKNIIGRAAFSAALGGVVHPACPGGQREPILSPGDLATLRFLSGKTLLAAARLTVTEQKAGELFRTLHPLTRHHTGFEARSFRSLSSGDVLAKLQS